MRINFVFVFTLNPFLLIISVILQLCLKMLVCGLPPTLSVSSILQTFCYFSFGFMPPFSPNPKFFFIHLATIAFIDLLYLYLPILNVSVHLVGDLSQPFLSPFYWVLIPSLVFFCLSIPFFFVRLIQLHLFIFELTANQLSIYQFKLVTGISKESDFIILPMHLLISME